MKTFVKKILMVAFTFVFVQSASAAIVGTAASNTGNCYPFGCSSSGWNPYQQVYSGTEFSQISIHSLSFFNTEYNSGNYKTNTGDYDIYLSTTARSVGGLSTDFTSNLGVDNTLVFSGSIFEDLGSFGQQFDIMLTSLFDYDPTQGNLLLTVISTNAASDGNTFFDYDYSSSVMSRCFAGDCRASQGLVTGFNLVDNNISPVPLPAAAWLFLTAMAGLAGISRFKKQ